MSTTDELLAAAHKRGRAQAVRDIAIALSLGVKVEEIERIVTDDAEHWPDLARVLAATDERGFGLLNLLVHTTVAAGGTAVVALCLRDVDDVIKAIARDGEMGR